MNLPLSVCADHDMSVVIWTVEAEDETNLLDGSTEAKDSNKKEQKLFCWCIFLEKGSTLGHRPRPRQYVLYPLT